MKRAGVLFFVVAVGAAYAPTASAAAGPPRVGTAIFGRSIPGHTVLKIPAGVHAIKYDLCGAMGGNAGNPAGNEGGYGRRVVGIFEVRPGEVLHIFVGGRGGFGKSLDLGGAGGTGGFNGGGPGGAGGARGIPGAAFPGWGSGGGGGGGASDIRRGGSVLASRKVIASGGGGGGGGGQPASINAALASTNRSPVFGMHGAVGDADATAPSGPPIGGKRGKGTTGGGGGTGGTATVTNPLPPDISDATPTSPTAGVTGALGTGGAGSTGARLSISSHSTNAVFASGSAGGGGGGGGGLAGGGGGQGGGISLTTFGTPQFPLVVDTGMAGGGGGGSSLVPAGAGSGAPGPLCNGEGYVQINVAQDVPTAPITIRAQSSGATGSATVLLGRPASQGIAPITGYEAACSSRGYATKSAASLNAVVVVKGLVNGVTYACTGRAKNAYGPGIATAPGVLVRVGSPGIPGSAYGGPGPSFGQVIIGWNASVSAAAPILDYRVACSRPGFSKGATVGVKVRATVISGLSRGIQHTCTVTARNRFGSGVGGSVRTLPG